MAENPTAAQHRGRGASTPGGVERGLERSSVHAPDTSAAQPRSVPEDELTRSAKIALNRWAARYERLENETARLREALAACDVALNWDEPRIVPTEDLPDQAAAIREARAALARLGDE